MKITDFFIFDSNGVAVRGDAFGNNLAFNCADCGHPVLATALENQRGFDEAHPSQCRGCRASYFLDLRPNSRKLYIHKLANENYQ